MDKPIKWPKMKDTQIDKMLELHDLGKSNRGIALALGFTSAAIRGQLAKFGRKTNRRTPRKLRIVNDHAICSNCNLSKHQDEFANLYNGDRRYKRSTCHQCQSARVQTTRSIEAYFRSRISQIKYRSKQKGLEFDLTSDWACDQYQLTGGRCFYSNQHMNIDAQMGIERNQLSFDRVDVTKGYTQANTVMCTYRMNSIKQDLTIEELRLWLPLMYQKIIVFLN